MEAITRNDTGPAVEDVQRRLRTIGLLPEAGVTGTFDEATAQAVLRFRKQLGLPTGEEIDDSAWAALVDASYQLGDRTLYLRMPYFHGNDVRELQKALGALGFACGGADGIFGAYTEEALRSFQTNLGLPSDGIAGAYTYAAIRNLHHSWEGKEAMREGAHLGFARAAEVLESHALCLFGTDEFTRSVASRMSNLALATSPVSKIVSADNLLVAPDKEMLLVHIALSEHPSAKAAPRVVYTDDDSLAVRLKSALAVARKSSPARVAIELPGTMWEDAGVGRSAQHFAITLLDALCLALAKTA